MHPADASEYELEDIHVLEQRSILQQESEASLASEVVSDEKLEELQASSLDDILLDVPGVVTTGGPRSSAESPQIRGLDSSKIVIYVDGVKQSFRTRHMGVVLVDPDDLKKVDIYKSSATSMRGGAGLGGGIFFTTKNPEDYLKSGLKFGAEIKGSFEHVGSLRKLGTRLYGKEGEYSYLLSGNISKSTDLKLSTDQRLENSAYEDRSLFFKNRWVKGKNEWKLALDRYERDDRIPLNPTSEVPSEEVDLTSDNQLQKTSVSLTYNRSINEYFQLNSNFYFNEHLLEKRRVSDQRLDVRRIRTYGFSLDNSFEKKYSDHSLNRFIWGLEGLYDDGYGSRAGGALPSFPGGSGIQSAGYVQYLWDYQQKISISPSLRYDYYKLSSDDNSADHKHGELSSKLALKYQLLSWSSLFINYNEGFNAPRLRDIYPDGLHFPGDGFIIPDNYFVPNPDLKYETSSGYEVGLKNQWVGVLSEEDMFSFNFSFYRNMYHNYINFIVDALGGTTQFVNIERAKIFGNEVKVEYLWDRVELSAAYSRSRGYDLTGNSYIESMPADTLSVSVKYINMDRGLRFGYELLKAYDQYRVNYGSTSTVDKTDDYMIHSIFWNHELQTKGWQGLKYGVRIDNLTNRKYRKHASTIFEVGRNIKFSIKYKF